MTAEHFHQLVSMLVAALAEELQQHVLDLVAPMAELSPDYATFRAVTKSCMLLELLSSPDPDRVSAGQRLGDTQAHAERERLCFWVQSTTQHRRKPCHWLKAACSHADPGGWRQCLPGVAHAACGWPGG